MADDILCEYLKHDVTECVINESSSLHVPTDSLSGITIKIEDKNSDIGFFKQSIVQENYLASNASITDNICGLLHEFDNADYQNKEFKKIIDFYDNNNTESKFVVVEEQNNVDVKVYENNYKFKDSASNDILSRQNSVNDIANPIYLLSNFKVHPAKKVNSCRVCGKVYTKPYEVIVHMRAHTGERPYSCDICGKSFICKKNVKVHLRAHSGEKPFSCLVCGKAFSIKSSLNSHKLTHGEKIKVAVKSNNKYRKIITSCREIITSEKRYTKCQGCGKMFENVKDVIAHLIMHCDNKSHSCQVCGKSFPQSLCLKRHRCKPHEEKSENKQFICRYCGVKFGCALHLNAHKCQHTGGKSFPCQMCGKLFIASSDLVRHKRTHKRYPCQMCGRLFRETSNVLRHMSVHNGKIYSCQVCGKSYTTALALSSHRSVHIGLMFSCQTCGKSFPNYSQLRKHKLRHAEQNVVE